MTLEGSAMGSFNTCKTYTYRCGLGLTDISEISREILYFKLSLLSGCRRGGTADVVRKGIPYNHVDLSRLVSVKSTRVWIPIGNCEVLLVAVFKFPVHAWSDSENIWLLSFRQK